MPVSILKLSPSTEDSVLVAFALENPLVVTPGMSVYRLQASVSEKQLFKPTR